MTIHAIRFGDEGESATRELPRGRLAFVAELDGLDAHGASF